MPKGNRDGQEERTKKYAEARVDGKNGEESKRIAGYSETTHPHQIEKPGSLASNKIREVLEKRGINEEWLAKEYEDGIELSKRDGAKDKSLMAHVQYLRSIGYLLGHHKQSPSVAVQINNHPAETKPVDLGTVKELFRLVEEELGRREPGAVLSGSAGASDPKPFDGVDSPVIDAQDIGGGGEP